MARNISLREALGLDDVRLRLLQALVSFRGEVGVMPTRIDRTSLLHLRPWLGFSIWRDWLLGSRRRSLPPVMISNLFNRTPTPIEQGWSVRYTQVRDFRGRRLTYDSHNGTDFVISPGTTVVAAAPGRVAYVVNEYNRGGLKVVIEHGGNLITSSNHLARALVVPGEEVRRGQPIAISGYSGVDGLFTFPFGMPHVHFNVWLNGEAVDPFAADGEVSLWRQRNQPRPYAPHDDIDADEDMLEESSWDAGAIDGAIELCMVPKTQAALRAIADVPTRGVRVVFEQITYPLRFTGNRRPYATEAPRAPVLDLPFATGEVGDLLFLG